MAYTPPNNDAVDFIITDGYTAPAYNDVDFIIGDSVSSTTQISNDTLGISESAFNLFGIILVATNEILSIIGEFIRTSGAVRYINESLSISETFVSKTIIYVIKCVNDLISISDTVLKSSIMICLMNSGLRITELINKNYGIFRYILDSIGILDTLIHKRKSVRILNTIIQITENLSSKFDVVFRILKKFVGYSEETFYHISKYKSTFYHRVVVFGKYFFKGRSK